MDSADSLVLSCEHASNRLPENYAKSLGIPKDVLQSHRGYDLGTQRLTRELSGILGVDACLGSYSRLLVEQNRTLGHADLWSEYSANLSNEEKRELLDTVYNPYVRALQNRIEEAIERCGWALHVSIHSFTPIWNGQKREVDFGVLFDPARRFEKKKALQLIDALARAFPEQRVLANEPYAGVDDGIVLNFRNRFSEPTYAGIEIEVNQALLEDEEAIVAFASMLSEAIAWVVAQGSF